MVIKPGYMQKHHGLRKLDKSGFNRRWHRLEEPLIAIFHALGATFKQLNTTARYVIFPVAVCRNCRIPVCKLLNGKAYQGYNEAKKEYFYGFKVQLYGFKVQLIVTADNLPVDYFIVAAYCRCLLSLLIVAGSFHDATALQAMNIHLPK